MAKQGMLGVLPETAEREGPVRRPRLRNTTTPEALLARVRAVLEADGIRVLTSPMPTRPVPVGRTGALDQAGVPPSMGNSLKPPGRRSQRAALGNVVPMRQGLDLDLGVAFVEDAPDPAEAPFVVLSLAAGAEQISGEIAGIEVTCLVTTPSWRGPAGSDEAAHGQGSVVEDLGQPHRGPAEHPVPDDLGLTAREVEVLQIFANGATTTQAGRQLYVSPKTVKNHLAHIYAKLGVTTRTQAIAKGLKGGIVFIR